MTPVSPAEKRRQREGRAVKVKELVAALQKKNQEADVCVAVACPKDTAISEEGENIDVDGDKQVTLRGWSPDVFRYDD